MTMMISPTAMSELAAHAIYESSDDRECRYLHLEWMVDFFVAADVDAHFNMAKEAYEKLRAGSHDQANQFEYNDLDCHAFTVPWGKDEQAFAHRDQNNNHLYVLSERANLSELSRALGEGRNLRVYQYWDVMPEHEEDRWTNDPHEYADLGGQYDPERPTLEWLVEHDGTRYGDCRDHAFVTRTPGISGRADHTVYKLRVIRWSLFNINTLWTALTE